MTLLNIFIHNLRNVFNVFLFLPYYFNVATHLRNLFAPWKRIISAKHEKGFSLSAWGERVSLNLVSRGIGFILRSTVLLSYLVSIGLYIFVGVPLWIIFNFLSTPIMYIVQLISPAEHTYKKALKDFVSAHTLEESNRKIVEEWFERQWQQKQKEGDIFLLSNLLSISPIGRDWTYGYTPFLERYAYELTVSTELTVPIGREKELVALEHTLLKLYEPQALLVGEEGVGKETLIDGFADRLIRGKTMPGLQNMRVLELNMEKVLAQRQSTEEKLVLLESILSEARMAKNIVLVIADIHHYCSETLLGDYTGVWEKMLKENTLRIIGTTTPFYYEHIIFPNDTARALFTKITIEETTPAQTLHILQDKTRYFEQRHGVVIPYEVLAHIVERSMYYITYLPFPEKALSLLDEVATYAQEKKSFSITAKMVDECLSARLKLPVGIVTPDVRHKLLNLKNILGKRIYGQDVVLERIERTFKRAFIEENRKKPRASFLFLGPTGVGKTETAKALARIFFNDEAKLIRFDMSFYQDKKALSDLIGSIDTHDVGLLAQSVRENPYSIFLVDEIEKAHRDIVNIFLTLLDEGYLVDGLGERVDGKNLIIIVTSNAGAKEIHQWVIEGKSTMELEQLIKKMVIDKGIFTPEFLGRFDNVLVFEPLTKKSAYAIAYKTAQQAIREYQKTKGITLTIDQPSLTGLVDKIFTPEAGARDIERVVREHLANKVSDIVLKQ